MPQTDNPKRTFTLDVESYPNLFTVQIKDVQNPSCKYLFSTFKPEDRTLFHSIISNPNNTFVTFNGLSYDLLMVDAYLHTPHLTPEQLNQVSNLIIQDEVKPYQFTKVTGITITYRPNHIDLMDVAPGKASLKAYASRLHVRSLQDLPYDPATILTQEQMMEVVSYCFKDLDNTEALLMALIKQVQLRVKMSALYGTDLRSKSDPQIAETVIVSELSKLLGEKPRKPAKSSRQPHVIYDPPQYLTFHSPQLQEAFSLICHTPFPIASGGKLDMPQVIKDLTIKINSTSYNLGMGGLHSMEKEQAIVPPPEMQLADFDVTSYYPRIILNNRLYPEHLTPSFLDIYESIVDRRVEAKHNKDKVTADTLKIVVNGSFGKFGSPYSVLYSPKLLIQTTVTGQLSLLMLIEWLEAYGFQVVSANTDGIVVYGPQEKDTLLGRIIRKWESVTAFEMERTDYKALYSRDVNNYIAVKPDNTVKVKGAFAYAGLQKNPVNEVCIDAVTKYLTESIDIGITINSCQDVRRFLQARSVRGGAVKDGVYLGKVVRWYYSTNTTTPINYKTNGNKVPNSDNGMPLMDLPDNDLVPNDLDRDAYIREANEMLMDLGVISRPPKKRKPRAKKEKTE